MTTTPAGMTVGGLLESRPDALGLDLELLAGGEGLARINIQDLFGIASTRTSKRVELVVRLARAHHAACKRADRLERQLQLAGMDQLDDSEIDGKSDPTEEE